MAFYNISSFYYNEETGNIFLYITKNADVSYDYSPEYQAVDIYEAQVYLDGGLSLIGKSRPPSFDGEIPGGEYGRGPNPNGAEGEPMENAPE